MNDDLKHIEALLHRFLAAQTSEPEERELAEYFRTAHRVPSEWQAYADMFRIFEQGETLLRPAEPAVQPKRRRGRWVAAAVFALGFGVALAWLWQDFRMQPEPPHPMAQAEMPQTPAPNPPLSEEAKPETPAAKPFAGAKKPAINHAKPSAEPKKPSSTQRIPTCEAEIPADEIRAAEQLLATVQTLIQIDEAVKDPAFRQCTESRIFVSVEN